MDTGAQLARSQELSSKVAQLYQKRLKIAKEKFSGRVQKAYAAHAAELTAHPPTPMDMWTNFWNYGVDVAQRSILFWDTLRERGNNYLEHVQQGQPPVLHFDFEMLVDARKFKQPVNYALVRIIPPAGVSVDPKRRPYIIIDPRAGHGPGIGGFKDDSQVGVALREGHPVYFVIFFREPEPGQTLLDVCSAEQQFVRKVRALHPDSPKPALIGNCQGGWAAMMLAASEPDEMGPIVINGAPMSYWGGAWQEGEGDNPMRYAGGMLGGSWLASYSADLGNGVFDGAHLVKNFEDLNPANTFWDKYYHLYANIDTERPRFLEFERWWGGFYLMNREEIEWITRNLFVGNKIWKGDVESKAGHVFDLREIKVPIILFASMGDNITPPQQAFNWIADVYTSTEEIKARGQVIVGLLHHDIGHLGIFVSGKVANKEHKQIVSVLKSVEMLPPGLYGMQIKAVEGGAGKTEYEVEFHEHQLEDITKRLNRLQRNDEKPFEAVAAISEFNQRGYEMFAQPMVRSMSNDFTAKLRRELHPLRSQRWAISDSNPLLAWLAPAAQTVKAQRKALAPNNAARTTEKLMAELVSASLDLYRGMRDAATEAFFFQTYGSMFSVYLADKQLADAGEAPVSDPRELPFVKEALASIAEGGYDEAFARVGFLIARKGDLPLSRLTMRQEMQKDYADFVPKVAMDQWRRIRGEQEIIARYEPERAIETLPKLLSDPAERERLLMLIDRVLVDERLQSDKPTPEQFAMVERIRAALSQRPPAGRPLAAVGKAGTRSSGRNGGSARHME
jgi:pimeloyl-ACP methyl ester carboxylesterase